MEVLRDLPARVDAEASKRLKAGQQHLDVCRRNWQVMPFHGGATLSESLPEAHEA